MNLPPCLEVLPDGVRLSIRVQPRASRNEIGPVDQEELKVRVTAPPVDSAANDAVLRLLAEKLDCARSAVELIRGKTSRHKQILIRGLKANEVSRRLAED